MKVLMEGSTGFIGHNVKERLEQDHEVVVVNRRESADGGYVVDLSDSNAVQEVIERERPEAIVSCLGVVNTNEDLTQNEKLTRALLDAVLASTVEVDRIVISGSAGEYGLVDTLPVSEDAPLRATSGYGISKIEEEETARRYADTHELPIVVARIFNPVGVDMKERFLIPSLLRQVRDYKAGATHEISISRLDAERDYIDVKDLADGFEKLTTGVPRHFAYNLGSGKATSNAELLRLILKFENLENPKIVETSDVSEQMVASQADITRMREDFNWEPKRSLEETIGEIVS